MFVLGIDPGLSRCGYGAVRRDAQGLRALSAGVVRTGADVAVPERLRQLHGELRALVDELSPDAVVVERVLFQTNARTAMSVGQAAGVALLVAAEAGRPVAQYSANEVKMAVVGYGSATKDQVQRMVGAVLGLAEPPRPPDVADALALAICHLGAGGLRRRLELSAGKGLGGGAVRGQAVGARR
jgi:crossover junction endodeoxyribonuclease RuvC